MSFRLKAFLFPASLGLAVLTASSAFSRSDVDFTQFVDPFIGTAGKGHTFPGAAYPLGLVQLSPDTGIGSWEYCAGYQYADTSVDGFSHTHASGGGTGDFGDVLLLPFSNDEVLTAARATQDKSAEAASPGYYTTRLREDDITVELSATERTGIHRYTFNGNGRRQLFLSIDRVLWSFGDGRRGLTHDAELTIDGPTAVSGGYVSKGKARREVYFAVEFSQPLVGHRFLEGSDNKKLVLDFGAGDDHTLVVRTGISTVSPDSARRNLEVESRGKSFAAIREEAREAWNHHLGKIEIRGAPERLTQFYTAMYHLHIQPNNIADVDGKYRGADEAIYQTESGRQYAMLALWDVYRAAWPLNSLLDPELHGAYLRALLDHYDQAGHLPVWGIWGKSSQTMIGNHGVTVLWDGINKGVPGIDEAKAFQAMKDSLTIQHGRKSNWENYDPYGYFPSDIGHQESVSRTLETSLNDWCAAQLAERLGRTEDAAYFGQRARFYRNLYNPGTGFFQGRLTDGSWHEPFDPLQVFHNGSSSGDYTEANAWQYLWSVQQDVPDLVALMGGPFAFGQRLDELFSLPEIVYGKGATDDVDGLIGQYAHGNEPSHHVTYLYNYAGRPHRTQELVRQVMDTLYQPRPDGLSGNDDFGQMSGWYIFSALGLFPVHPAAGVYDLGVPGHEYARVRLGDSGRTLTVRAEPFDSGKPYVHRVTFNGAPVETLQISHEQLVGGGELVFEMTDRPASMSLFNGRDLTGWRGNPEIWTVEDGAITGRTTEGNLLTENQFLIWDGGEVADFILTLKARQSGNNSGVQYRSRETPEIGPWTVGGYQCDIHPTDANNGMLYDQYGRAVLARNGQRVLAAPRGITWMLEEFPSVVADDSQWTEYRIEAKGNRLTHYMNGELTVEFADYDHEAGAASGLIALQMHRGPAMEVQFKDITLQLLPTEDEPAARTFRLSSEARMVNQNP